MCGILAYIQTDGTELPETLPAALESLAHRGPDSQQAFSAEGVFLGHRRLKIIDLEDRSNQPMFSDDRRYVLIYNGEIYNYRELRARLESLGHRFHTTGDTEVLLHMYIEFGAECLRDLNGMYSFAIYDREQREFFAARDRMGIKPLYYSWDGKSFGAASELRALVVANRGLREIDPVSLAQYLFIGAVHPPRTIFLKIKALPPGHYLRVSNNTLSTQRYWAPPFIPEQEKRTVSPQEAAGTTREILEESIQMQLVSDVPLGAFLSGGFDSSVVVGAMARKSSLPPNTFSISFDVGGEDYNENSVAETTADHFGCHHHKCLVSSTDVVNALPHFVDHLDQPTCDGINTYFVSKFAREHVTVAISGLGGDEIFAGYRRTQLMRTLQRVAHMTPPLPRAITRRLSGWAENRSPSAFKRKQVQALATSFGNRPTHSAFYLLFLQYFSRPHIAALLGSNDEVYAADLMRDLQGGDALGTVDASCYYDQQIYMASRLLRDTDVMSMAHSLEVRVPFLDHRLVEYVAQLPEACKFVPGRTKPLLAQAFKDLLPQHVLDLKKKGFLFPLNLWMQQTTLKDIVAESLSPSGLLGRGILNSDSLAQITHSCLHSNSGTINPHEGELLYMLTILELWLRRLDEVTAPTARRNSVAHIT